MAIEAKFFASLREKVGMEQATVEASGATTARAIWEQATGGQPVPDNLLVAVNMEYADLESNVSDGDEVAFFPPVTGGAR